MTLVDRLGGDLPRGPRHRGARRHPGDGAALSARAVLRHARHAPRRRCAGRPRVPAQADAACRLRRRLVAGRRGLDRGRHQLRRAGGAGRAGGLAAELPRGVPRGDGRARRPAPRLRAERSRRTGSSRSAPGRSTSGSASSATPKRSGAAPWRWRAQQYEGFSGVTVLMTQDFGAQPGDLNPLGYKDSHRPARHRGQRRRAVARPGTADQGRRVHPRLSRRGRRAAADAPAGRAGPQRHVRRAAQVPVARRDVQPIPARARRQTEQERELLAAKLVGRWRSGAPLTLAPDAGRPGARRRPAAEQRLHLRRRSARPAGAARLAHAAHEPARHRDGAARRREHPPHHPAQHDLRGALRPERDLRAGRRGRRAASTSSSSAPRRWPRWSSCSRSGSTTATS